jgi:hypothetical protein
MCPTTLRVYAGAALIDCAPWEIRHLVAAIIRSEAARKRFRELAVPPDILSDEPEAQAIVAHALSEATSTPPHVDTALDHRVGDKRTWRETLTSYEGWPDDWHVRDVDRCCVKLAARWLPSYIRWGLEAVERGDLSRLPTVMKLLSIVLGTRHREVA